MATGNEAVMQALLDQVDRMGRRQRIAFGVMFCALVALLLWIGHISGRPQTDVKEVVFWSVISTVFAVAYGVISLAICINRHVPRILKAIEMVETQGAKQT